MNRSLVISFLLIGLLNSYLCVIQGIIDPAYFDPGPYWTTLENSTPQLAIAVANVDNGPGTSPDASYVTTLNTFKRAGGIVLGYVYTSQGTRSSSAVQKDINNWVSFYTVSGVFFDEAPDTCLHQSYYQDLYNYVHNNINNATVIINPGTQVPQCLSGTADIICNFESSYNDYINNYENSTWSAPATKFYHIVYAVPSANDLSNLATLSIARNAAWIFYTTDTLPNPYDTLPASSFWNTELGLVE